MLYSQILISCCLIICILINIQSYGKESPYNNVTNLGLISDINLSLNKLFTSDEEKLKQERLSQLLVVNKKPKEFPKLSYEKYAQYIDETRVCLYRPEQCTNSTNDFNQSFYSYITDKDKAIISKSILNNKTEYSTQRLELINTIFNKLTIGIQESIEPNKDKYNSILNLFQQSGLLQPDKELGLYRKYWAWCAAFVTSSLHAAGLGISYISLNDYESVCEQTRKKQKDNNYSCHPVQVDFILHWAHNHDLTSKNFDKLQPGDMLVVIDKDEIGQHIAFFLAQTEEYMYSLEGNIGPYINDSFLFNEEFAEVKKHLSTNKYSQQDIERLFDRLTIVKRPKASKAWSWSIHLPI